MPVPASLDWAQAGGLPETFTTAHDAIFTQGELRPRHLDVRADEGEWLDFDAERGDTGCQHGHRLFAGLLKGGAVVDKIGEQSQQLATALNDSIGSFENIGVSRAREATERVEALAQQLEAGLGAGGKGDEEEGGGGDLVRAERAQVLRNQAALLEALRRRAGRCAWAQWRRRPPPRTARARRALVAPCLPGL